MERHWISMMVTYIQDLVWNKSKDQNLHYDHYNSQYHKEVVEVQFSILYMQAHLDYLHPHF